MNSRCCKSPLDHPRDWPLCPSKTRNRWMTWLYARYMFRRYWIIPLWVFTSLTLQSNSPWWSIVWSSEQFNLHRSSWRNDDLNWKYLYWQYEWRSLRHLPTHSSSQTGRCERIVVYNLKTRSYAHKFYLRIENNTCSPKNQNFLALLTYSKVSPSKELYGFLTHRNPLMPYLDIANAVTSAWMYNRAKYTIHTWDKTHHSSLTIYIFCC